MTVPAAGPRPTKYIPSIQLVLPRETGPLNVRILVRFAWRERAGEEVQVHEAVDRPFILKQADDGVSVEDTSHKAGISIQIHYRWRQKWALQLRVSLPQADAAASSSDS